MPFTVNTLVFNQDTFVNPNRVIYTGPAHTFSSRDLFTLARTAPKPTKDDLGVGKVEIKRTKTVTLAGGATRDIIITITGSTPVGAAEADIDAAVDDAADFAISAEGKKLFKAHDINV
nr:MAG: coat protein [Leviviridae sp.]